MDYFIDLDEYNRNTKTKMWKNNDSKNVIAKMAIHSTVATNGASTLDSQNNNCLRNSKIN